MKYDQAFIETLKPIIARAGAEWCGIQECVPPSPDLLLFNSKKSRSTLAIPFQSVYDAGVIETEIRKRLAQSDSEFKGTKMNLREKLHKIYSEIDHIDKTGFNKSQSYKYLKSVDVLHAIRKALIELKIYAEINFDFVGAPYTIAREKAPNAPFTAVNARCSIVFHDLETNEKITSSGLGTGCDTSDKAPYKAQTGGLKYAIKNAFLVPDEADPEADESVDENVSERRHLGMSANDDVPDFHEAQHAAPRPNQPRPPAQETPKPAARPTPAPAAKAEASGATVAVSSPVTAPSAPAAAAPSTPEVAPAAAREPGDDSGSENGALPTEAQLAEYTAEYRKLCDNLAADGKLKSSPKLPINRKVLVFFLQITGAASAKEATAAQWDDFFARVKRIMSVDGGLIALRKKINKANGFDEDEKKKK